MARSVGLEIHARGVRAVEVAGRGSKVRVTRYAERALTPRGSAPDPDELHEALDEIFRSEKLSRNHVIAAVDAHETVVREIPVPFKSDDQIRKVIKYEAEHHLHDCDADDVIVQYTKVGESGDASNLLVFAARKDHIARRIDHARAANVEPLALDLDALAVYNAAHAAGRIDETTSCVLMHVGHRATGLVFVVDGDVRALRSVRIGVDSIAQGLARDMDVDFFEADSKLQQLTENEDDGDLFLPAEPDVGKAETEKSHAELERDLFLQKRDEFVARLKREFIRSSAALHGGRQPEFVLATGPGLLVPGLLDLLGQRLGTPVEAFHPSDAFPCRLTGAAKEAFDAGGVVALGLALKGAGHDPLGIDFRQEELRVANKFELLKVPLAVTVTLLFVGLLAFAFYSVLRKNELAEKRYEPMLTDAFQSFSDVTEKYNVLGDTIVPPHRQVDAPRVERDEGPRPEAIRRFWQRLQRMQRHLATVTGDERGIPQIRSALMTWNDIFELLRKNHEQLKYIDFQNIDIRQSSVRLTIVISDVAAAEELERLLEALPALEGWESDDWRAEPVRNTPYQRVTFQFKEPRR